LGIRRRRKKLTTILTSVDRRLRSVEFRHVPTRIPLKTITAAQIADGAVPSADPKDGGATGATSSTTAPTEFTTLVSAAYSPRNVTGSDDWVDIVTTRPHGMAIGDKVSLYGLNNHDVNLDGTYVITESASDTQFRFKRGLTGTYPGVVSLDIKATVASRSATTTEATLTLSAATHGFVVGDVITVSEVDDSFNGTFFISAVNGAEIKYNFLSALADSVAVTTSTGFIDAVLHKYAIIGDTWLDTSVTPTNLKIWDGLSWSSASSVPDGVIIDDGMAPKPPTNLRATTKGYYGTQGEAKVEATLSWDAPTENADGTVLRDLAGYKVYYKVGTDTGTETIVSGDGSTDTSTANTDGKLSGTISHANIMSVPSTVTLTSSAGTIFPASFIVIPGAAGSGSHAWTVSGLSASESVVVSWTTNTNSGSGTITGSIDSTDVSKTHVPASSTANEIFGDINITGRTQPTDSTPAPPAVPTPTEANWESLSDTYETTAIARDLPINATVMFMVQAYDSSKKNISVSSDVLSVATGKPSLILTSPSKPDILARLGTVTVTWDGADSAGATPPNSVSYIEVHLGTTSGFTPDSSTLYGRIEVIPGGYTVIGDLPYGSSYYAKLIFVSTTGFKTTASVASDVVAVVSLVDTDLIAKTLTVWPFQDKTVNVDALANNSVSARTLVANAVTYDAIAANAIGSNQIIAGSIGAGKIGANAITANEIAANTITAGMIKTNEITADRIKAGALDAFLITGAQIQTAKPISDGGQNARITLNSSGITAYNTSNAVTFTLNANTGAVTIGAYDASIANASATANTANSTATTANSTATTANTVANSKLGPGQAANDVNTYTTTINGGKITTGTVDANRIIAGTIDTTRILATDTFLYRNPGSTQSVSIGNDAVDGKSGNPGVSFNDGSNTSLGWLGYWSSGPALELGTNFLNNYIDMYNATNSVRWSSSGSIDINSDSILSLTGFNNLNLSSANGAIFAIGQFRNQYAYDNPVTTIPNLTVSTAGLLRRTTNANSSFDIKTDIAPLQVDIPSYLSLTPIIYRYKAEVLSGSANPALFSGFIAEDLDKLGFRDLVQYDRDGKPEAIRYDRITGYLHLVVKDQERRLIDLERKLEGK
jgi:hypothetical protein